MDFKSAIMKNIGRDIHFKIELVSSCEKIDIVFKKFNIIQDGTSTGVLYGQNMLESLEIDLSANLVKYKEGIITKLTEIKAKTDFAVYSMYILDFIDTNLIQADIIINSDQIKNQQLYHFGEGQATDCNNITKN